MLTDISSGGKITQKYFRAGTAVACRLMMLEGYYVIITHIIQLMTYSRKKPPARLHSADIADIGIPCDVIISHAFFQDAQIKNGIMRYEQSA